MRAGAAAILLFLISLAWPGPAAFGQMTTEDLIDTGPPDPKVESAISWERLQDDIKYLRPEAEFKPGENIQVVVPPRPASPDELETAARWSTGLIVLAIVVVVIVIFALFGNSINVSFGSTDEKRRIRSKAAEQSDVDLEDLPRDGLLERLASMPDRRRALILLTGHALNRAASANGVTLARAQTARDVLRVLPRQWRHMDAMRRLVREAEIVHFGGRDVSEETWADCLSAARPIFGPAGAAA